MRRDDCGMFIRKGGSGIAWVLLHRMDALHGCTVKGSKWLVFAIGAPFLSYGAFGFCYDSYLFFKRSINQPIAIARAQMEEIVHARMKSIVDIHFTMD